MMHLLPEDLAVWAGQPWRNGIPQKPLNGVSNDTRTLTPGSLYVALKGERFDGHDFLAQAFEKGAAAALVETDCMWGDHPVLAVPDTLVGLQNLAAGYRSTWSGTVIGITGSVGKTTVKEMCAAVLSAAGTVHRTAGNFNNHIGLPLTMLSMLSDAAYGVFEIGMNHPGEIGALAALLQPQAAVITDIGNAHGEFFESTEAIVREKAQLIHQIDPAGFVVLERDSEWFDQLCAYAPARIVTVSLGGEADYVGCPVTGGVEVDGYFYAVLLPGEHMLRNALRAIALGRELGLPPATIAAGIQQVKLPPMRWEQVQIGGIDFINDAYNANPLSMRANLRTFCDAATDGAKWAVLGGMFELGGSTEAEHVALGRFVDTIGLDGVICVGKYGRLIECCSVPHCFYVDDAAAAASCLHQHLQLGDQVLLKASRGLHLEQVLEYFKEYKSCFTI